MCKSVVCVQICLKVWCTEMSPNGLVRAQAAEHWSCTDAVRMQLVSKQQVCANVEELGLFWLMFSAPVKRISSGSSQLIAETLRS